MYLQHYNKNFKQTGEFNDDTSAIIFPQIMKFMLHKKLIQGNLLSQIVEKNIFDTKKSWKHLKSSSIEMFCKNYFKYMN